MKTIPLTRGMLAIVDDEDYARLATVRWYATGRAPYCYAVRDTRRNRVRTQIQMHRLIACAPAGMVVDHINRDTLDNRRTNLRVCRQAQNIGNARPDRKNNTTGFKGVSWRRDKRKYEAQIGTSRDGQRQTLHLGFFGTPEEAGIAYEQAARALGYTPN